MPTIVLKSELGSRFDAEFHIARQRVSSRVREFEAIMNRVEADILA